MIHIEDKTLAAIRKHAAAEYEKAKRECCGLVQIFKGRQRYVPCANMAGSPDEHFQMSPQDYANAEDQGDIVCIVHSHPYASPLPSEADRVMCEQNGLPWLIVNHPIGHWEIIEPNGYEAPLSGRKFVHGILDCLTLIQDYYRRELNITMPDFPREDEWWKKRKSDPGSNMYLDHYAECGFELFDQFEPLQVHDVILMEFDTLDPDQPNHAAVYVGGNDILHHYYGRISCRQVYGGLWRKNTRYVLRHSELPHESRGANQ